MLFFFFLFILHKLSNKQKKAEKNEKKQTIASSWKKSILHEFTVRWVSLSPSLDL